MHLIKWFSRHKLINNEAMGGVVLLTCAIVALIGANSLLSSSYEAFLQTPISFTLGDFSLQRNVHFIITDGLMTFFFLIAGMEIRHALHDGALKSWNEATLPFVAACGGVCVPAIIFLTFNWHESRLAGWAIPTATDIAFAIGILALLGRAIPAELRIILLSLAIIDDVIAVIIIALFYSNSLEFYGVAIATLGLMMVFLWQKIGVASAWGYCLPAAILWFGLWQTGIHPSLAGVILGMVTPVLPKISKSDTLKDMSYALKVLQQSRNRTLEETRALLHQIKSYQRDTIAPVIRVPLVLRPWVTFGIMPLFAFANAGVRFDDFAWSNEGSLPILLGTGIALIIGKPIGVIGASFIAVKCKICRLPPGLDWLGMALIGILAGIGFTMAIFIAMLAFDNPHYLTAAKIGILIGSTLSALIGLSLGIFYCRRRSPLT